MDGAGFSAAYRESINGFNLEEYHGTMVTILSTPAKSTSEYMLV